MNIWITLSLILAGIVFLLDLLIRRKWWKNNTKEEKISLLVNMFTAGPHLFLSAIGVFWGITSGGYETTVGKIIYTVTLYMGAFYFVVAIAAAISSLVLRRLGKIKASVLVNVIAIAYIILVLGINFLAGKVL